MLTRFWSIVLALLAVAACASLVLASEPATKRLNVVLVVADDLGWSDHTDTEGETVVVPEARQVELVAAGEGQCIARGRGRFCG